jgi:tetratricopeptide (TPR) repeat protein
MNPKSKIKNAKWRTGLRPGCLLFHFAFLLFHSASAAPMTNPAPVPAPTVSAPAIERAPQTPREFFNAGTRRLLTNQLREAEAGFLATLATQDDRLRPAALYNLGHVRFAQGVENLKKSPEPQRAMARAGAAAARTEGAIRGADAALAGQDLQTMIAAYQQGRGARREWREAEKVVRQALETHAVTLARWQRALGDFQSAAELNPGHTNAQHNADLVKRHIAKLIDQMRQMQQMLGGANGKQQQLKEKLDALKGRIPAENMPPGAAGDEEEEEEMPNGPRPGMEEGPSRDGEEQLPMSREDADRVLDGFRLDGERRLPMGGDKEAQPKDRNRPNW